MLSVEDTVSEEKKVDRFLEIAGWIVAAVAVLFCVLYVPMNMDEAGIYHYLACADYPFSHLHLFREACSVQNDLLLAGGLQLARPESYTGLFHSLLYAPFFAALHVPEAQYLFGLTLLALFAFLTSRLIRGGRIGAALLFAFFPFLIMCLHDTGPVSFHLLAFPLCALGFKKILDEPKALKFGYAALTAFVVAAAAEEKPFFLYLLPSIGFFALAFVSTSEKTILREKIHASWSSLLFGGVLAALGIGWVLFSHNAEGQNYFGWLIHRADAKVPALDWLTLLLYYLFFWSSFAHNFFTITAASTSLFFLSVLTGFFFFLILLAVVTHREIFRNYSKTRLAFLAASFLAMATIFFVIRNTWAGHHFIFLWVPLIVLFIDVLRRVPSSWRMGLGSAFLALNLFSVVVLTQLPFETKVLRDKEAIFSYLNREDIASEGLINFSSWGGYYIQSLYGQKTQLVTYTEPYASERSRFLPITMEDADALLKLSQKTGRRIYNVCYEDYCNADSLQTAFGNRISFEEVMPGLERWKLFRETGVLKQD